MVCGAPSSPGPFLQFFSLAGLARTRRTTRRSWKERTSGKSLNKTAAGDHTLDNNKIMKNMFDLFVF